MRRGALFLLVLPLIALISCTPEQSKIVVAEFGDHKIYMDDFENAYAKNSGGFEKAKNDSIGAYKNFLDLYVNYKMKLRDAEVRGYTEDPDMQKEYHDYKINIGTALYLENVLYEPNLHKLYERRKTEYRASHIFLRPDSTHNDKQIQELGAELIKRINNGEDFSELAKKYSVDKYSKDNGGDVYYFTSGLVASRTIEDAVYATEPGHIYPELVKSPFGYHIIKVTEKHPRRVSIRVAHILIPFGDSSGVDTAKALKTIQDIQAQIKDGADFGLMAMKYSKDKSTANKRGDMGFIERGRTSRIFDEAAFNLKKGEVSPIIKGPDGFHLITVTDETPYPTYEQDKEELKNIYRRIGYKEDYDNLIAKLKTELKYKLNEGTFNKILAMADTTKIGPDYANSNLQKQTGKDTIFTIGTKPYSTDSLFAVLDKRPNFLKRKIDSQVLSEGINGYSAQALLNEKALIYDKEDKEFAQLLDEYKKGMYLFKILDQEVWSKVSTDSAKVLKYFEANRDKFQWKDRVEFKEIYNQKDSLINNCYAMVASGFPYDSAAVKFNQRRGYDNTPGYNGLVEVGFNELATQASALKNIGDISKPFKFQNGWSIVKLIKREAARPKTFEEARAEASSQLQEKESKQYEATYIDNLKSIYHPKYYYDELRYAFKPQN